MCMQTIIKLKAEKYYQVHQTSNFFAIYTHVYACMHACVHTCMYMHDMQLCGNVCLFNALINLYSSQVLSWWQGVLDTPGKNNSYRARYQRNLDHL